MTSREQPDPGEGWRLAIGEDCKDERCQYWNDCLSKWMERPLYTAGRVFSDGNYYRIPITIDAQPATHHGGDHYRQGGIECIDAIRAALTPEEFRGFCKGNVIKYVWRENHKGGDADLGKAGDYLKWTQPTEKETTK